ncbi:MAG: hypothetical protein Q9188_006775 [Gyalolechia gomerana]
MTTPDNKKTITVLGSLNTDLLTLTTRLPTPGETLPSLSFSTGPGGKGANQAVACARLSHQGQIEPSSSSSSSFSVQHSPVQVRMVGAVGDDVFGHELLKCLRGGGVDVSGVRVVPDGGKTGTGTAVVIVEQGSGENRILVNAGANGGVGMGEDLGRVFEEVFGGKGTDLLVMQCEIPLGTVVGVLKEAKRRGVQVLWNPAPAPTEEGDGDGDGEGGIADSLYGLHHLILNHAEAVTLASTTASTIPTSNDGFDYHHGNNDEDRNPRPDLQRLHISRHFHSLGVENVVITLGAEGVFWSCKGEAGARKSGNLQGKEDLHTMPAAEVGTVEAVKVENVVDTTAAGDTFVGAYAVGVSDGLGVGEAVRWANRAAARAVERSGAMGSIPFRGEVE